MIHKFLLALFVSAFAGLSGFAQSHTIIALSHNDHSIYELDPATGKVLHQLKVPDQPHEAAISADGKTIFASIPLNADLVEMFRPRSRQFGAVGCHITQTEAAQGDGGVSVCVGARLSFHNSGMS